MSKKTAIQLLRESIDSEVKLGTKMVINWDAYLKMEREQIIEAFDKAYPYDVIGYDAAEQYYNQTYKGGEQ